MACRLSAELDETLALHGLDRFAARKRIVERLEARAARQDRADHPHGAARRPLRRGDRAVSHRSVVRRRQDAGAAGDRGGARGARPCSCPQQWEATFFNWMENIQPWCISRQIWWGHQIPGLVRAGRQSLRRRERRRCGRRCARALHRHRRDHGRGGARHRRRSGAARAVCQRISAPRRGRARHLVLLGAVAVLDARLARRDAGAEALSTRPACSSPASTSSSSGSRA